MSTRNLIHLFMGCLLFATALNCGGDDPMSASETGTLEVRIVDNPAALQEVNVNIEAVMVNRSQASAESGWEVISNQSQTIDLLTLVNGNSALLGSTELESGSYSQVRLIFGSDNTIKVADTTLPLTFSGSGQTEATINIDSNVETGSTTTLLLDFDVAQSVNLSGSIDVISNLTASLSPVIHQINLESTGNVSGTVSPTTAGRVKVSVEADGRVISTYSDESSGQFKLMGIPDGTYSISMESSSEAFASKTIESVEVSAQQTTDIGVVVLAPAD